MKNTVQGTVRDDPETGIRARRRVTRRLIPFLMLTYLLAYIDRANLGVAKLQMQRSLGFTDEVIGLGAGIFFFGYLILDIPAGVIVERWSARKWLAGIMVSWGIVAAAMSLLGTPWLGHASATVQFYALRLLLGIAEAGFFPAVIVYLSHWYTPADRPRAKAYFMVTQPLAIAIGVPLSRWILENIHAFGFAGWQWVFALEGAPPILLGFVTLYYLTDRPRDAQWLPAEERAWLGSELEAAERAKSLSGKTRILDAVRHPQTWLLIIVYFLIVMGNQSLIFFLPSIANSIKGASVAWQTAVAALPYACSAIGILSNGFWAQRTGDRRWHTALPVLATGISLSLATMAGPGSGLAVVLLCLAGLTCQAYLPVFWTIPSSYLGKDAAAAAVGFISLGTIGGFVGPSLFGYLRTVTGQFQTGMLVLSGCMITAGLLAMLIRTPAIRELKRSESRGL